MKNTQELNITVMFTLLMQKVITEEQCMMLAEAVMENPQNFE